MVSHESSIVWITLINHGYVDYTKNFVQSMVAANVGFTLKVYCIDQASMDALAGFSPLCECHAAADFLKDKRLPSEMKEWLALDYKRITMSKLDAIVHALKTHPGQPVGYIDTDIVLFSDPSPLVLKEMEAHKDVHVFAQCDERGSVCSNRRQCTNFCTGVVVFRNMPDLYDLFQYTRRDVVSQTGDQEFLNSQFQQRGVTVWTLDRAVFPNGCFLPQLKDAKVDVPSSACLLHFNWMVGHQKKASMQRQGLWRL